MKKLPLNSNRILLNEYIASAYKVPSLNISTKASEMLDLFLYLTA